MKAMRKTIIATSLFALPGLASALGLGNIDVKSGLNEPLVAEIRVLVAGPEEQEGLRVGLARPEDFANVGLDYARLSMELDFAVGSNDRGETIIRVTSRDAVREPFLSLLVEVNWANGRLLREYSLLLDPPVMASARQGPKVQAQPVIESAPASTEPVPAPEPVAAEPAPVEPVAEPVPEPVASEPPPPEPVYTEPAPPEPVPAAESAPVQPMPEPAPVEPVPEPVAPEPVPVAVGGGEYGPVGAGENLYQIAQKTRPDSTVSVDQMMVSILRMNPQAFYQDNINALKTGAILRIPGSAEVVTVDEARSAVQEHNALWSSYAGRASDSPTLVSDAGSNSVAAESANTGRNSDRLELVAPRTGDSQGSADRPNGQANAASAEQLERVRGELSLAKEDLASAQKESTDLRSRVRELEEINQSRDSLIQMKNDEIADLERRIRELQAAAASVPATTSSVEAVASSVPDVVVPETSSSVASLEASSSSVDSTPVANAGSEGEISKEDIWGQSLPESSSSVADLTATSDPSADLTSASSADASDLTASSEDGAALSSEGLVASSEPAIPDETGVSSEPVSAQTTPVTDTTPAAAMPVTEEPGFLEQYWMWIAGGGGLLLLLGLFAAMRKPKAAPAPVDDQPVEDLPLDGFMSPAPAPAPYMGTPTPQPFEAFDADPEMALRSQIESDPDNLGAHLELLRLFYGRNDANAFEDAAQAMRARLYDTQAPEWQEAQAMGEVLVPNSSLFASAPDLMPFDTMDLPPLDSPAVPVTRPGPAVKDDDRLDALDLGAFDEPAPAAPAPAAFAPAPAQEFEFDLNLEGPTKRVEAVQPPPAAPAPAASAGDDLSFDFDFDLGPPAPAPAPAPAPVYVAPAPVAPAPAPAPAFEPSTLDLPDFNFDADIKPVEKVSFEPTEKATAVVSVETPELSAPEIIREPELPALDDPLFQSDDAVGTKLDLARAYLDMGDPDGARSMLEEVMIEGDDRQQNEARELLARLG